MTIKSPLNYLSMEGAYIFFAANNILEVEKYILYEKYIVIDGRKSILFGVFDPRSIACPII